MKKSIYFVANWKMNGGLNSLKDLIKINKFLFKRNSFKIIVCPPILFTKFFATNLNKLKFSFGSQDVSVINKDFGAYTGEVSSKMLIENRIQYVLVGHSERRVLGDTNQIIKYKIISALRNKVKVIFCFGENLKDKKNNLSLKVLKKQILSSVDKKLVSKNIIFAYEPIWSIGTGVIPEKEYLNHIFSNIREILKEYLKLKNPEILYGGSVSSETINDLKKVNYLSGFLVGGASLKSSSFINLLKSYKYN